MPIEVYFSPFLLRPGDELNVCVTTQDPDEMMATNVDVHLGFVGELRGRGYVALSLSKDKGGAFVGRVKLQPEHPVGLMEAQWLAFTGAGKSIQRISPKDFAPKYFRLTEDASAELLASALEAQAAALRQSREQEFLSSWGDPNLATHYVVYVFFRNCFARGGDIVLRKAKIFGMPGIAGDDVLNSIETFFQSRLGLPFRVEPREDINIRFRQSAPGIAIYFPRVAAQSHGDAFKTIQVPASHISLLMSADAGAAPEFFAAVVIRACFINTSGV